MKIEEWIKVYYQHKSDWALITGGSSGIGKEYLSILAAAGCRCLSISEDGPLNQSVCEELTKKHCTEVRAITCDLSNQTELAQVLETLKNNYSIPIVISNAGFGIKGRFLERDLDLYMKIIGVHVIAPTQLSYNLLPKMIKEDRGVFLNVATINVISPIPKNSVYTATKAYLYNLSLAISKECEDSHIYFQTMLPGTTKTPFHDKQGATPMKMTMTPDLVARKSLNHIDQLVYIPNVVDRYSAPLISLLPVRQRMSLASFMLKRRLGV